MEDSDHWAVRAMDTTMLLMGITLAGAIVMLGIAGVGFIVIKVVPGMAGAVLAVVVMMFVGAFMMSSLQELVMEYSE